MPTKSERLKMKKVLKKIHKQKATFPCPFCKQKFRDTFTITNHMRFNHNFPPPFASTPERDINVSEVKTAYEEPQSSRLDRLKKALSGIDFGFTVFFTSESGVGIKYFQGAVTQQEVRR